MSPVDYLADKLGSLSPTDRAAFHSLAYAPSAAEKQGVPLAIFSTNAIATTDGAGIFPKTARLNHACSAGLNAVYDWRDDEGVLGMWDCLLCALSWLEG